MTRQAIMMKKGYLSEKLGITYRLPTALDLRLPWEGLQV